MEKMTKRAAWLLVAPLVLVLAACQQTPTEVPVIPTEEPVAAEVAPTEVPTEEPATGIPYYSEAGDFCLSLPASWEGRYQPEELTGAEAEALYAGATSVTRLMYVPTDTSLTAAPLVTIMTMAKADFEAIDPAQSPPPGTQIAEGGDVVWLLAAPQSNPYDATSPDGLTFDAMYADLGDITTRFNAGACPEEATGAAGGLPAEVVGTAWQWTKTGMNDDSTFEPTDPAQYTVTFAEDGTVSVQADCNMAAGTYEADATTLSIAMGPMTLAMCPEGSLSDTYIQQLGQVGGWMMDGADLVLLLKFDSGSMMHAAP
jgi:heat shock protein HslJ